MEQPQENAPSIREALEQSVTELQEPAAPAPAQEQPAPAPQLPAAGEQHPAPAKLTDTPPQAAARQQPPQPGAQAAPAAPAPAVGRGPTSWKPEVREKWGSLPPEVQAEVMRREREVVQVLQASHAARQFFEHFRNTTAPYQQYIAMNGNGDPLQTYGQYLRTATILRAGSPIEKATAIAQAVQEFGVDVNVLDQALSTLFRGTPPPQAQQGQGQQQFRDPRMDELLTLLTNQQQEEHDRINQAAAEEATAFASDPANEFFEDLKHEVSDLLLMAANRGQKLSLGDAYKKACMMHPEISKIVVQRDQAKAQQAQQAALQQRRTAASSLRPEPPRQTGEANGGALSIRAAIEQAAQQLS